MKNISLLILSLYILNTSMIRSQNITLPLWEGNIPNLKKTNEKEESFTDNGILFLKNIQNPNITVYIPSSKKVTGEAVIICPGGGYWNLAYNWEGSEIAKALNSKGIIGIVLKYRLPTSDNYIIKEKSPLLDAQRAMRLVRFHAGEWGINPNKIGIMGFSAGGHLASTLSTHYDLGNQRAKDKVEKMSCRPDFSILIYPVISFIKPYSHKGSANALLGENATEEKLKYYSNELQVTNNTPPAFLIHATDDEVVPVENSITYFQALKDHDILAEMHIYPYGGHGFSLATGRGHLSSWINRCTDWIKYINK